MTVQEAKNKWVAWHRTQVGYHEVGDNHTKYAQDSDFDTRLYGFDMDGLAWCDYYSDYSFMYNFGFETGVKMTYQYVGCQGAACRYSAEYYKNNDAWYSYPEVGDQVFFYVSGAINHTECVIELKTDSNGNVIGFYTVGGNSSDAVRLNYYSVGASTIAGFGRPDWSLVADDISTENTTETASSSDSDDTIHVGSLVSIVPGSTYYSGLVIPNWVFSHNWYVYSINGNRVVINKSQDGSISIMSPIHIKCLKLVSNTAQISSESAESVTAKPTYQTYTVKSGDTLWAIAKTVLGNPLKYKEIKTLNGLTSDIIQVGQVLTLPE
jgi:LysM repeat protein